MSETVGVAETDGGKCLVRFADLELGIIDRRSKKFYCFRAARPGRPEATQDRNIVTHLSGRSGCGWPRAGGSRKAPPSCPRRKAGASSASARPFGSSGQYTRTGAAPKPGPGRADGRTLRVRERERRALTLQPAPRNRSWVRARSRCQRSGVGTTHRSSANRDPEPVGAPAPSSPGTAVERSQP